MSPSHVSQVRKYMNDRQLRPVPTSQGLPSYGGARESALSTTRVLRNT